MRAISWLLLVVACGAGDEPTPTDPEVEGACADPVYFDLELSGLVTDDGAPAEGVEVRLEERNRAPGTVHGTSATGPDGRFVLLATDLPIIEGCWGWATGFFIVAQRGSDVAEWGINSIVTNAWQQGEDAVELRGVTLDVGAP